MLFVFRLDALDYIVKARFKDHVADVVTLFLKKRLFSSVGVTNQQDKSEAQRPTESLCSWRMPGSDYVQLSFERIEYFGKNNRNQMWDYIFSLLEQGADINARDGNGRTVLFYITCEDKKYLQKLIALGIDLRAEDKDGNTALDRFCKQHFCNHYVMPVVTRYPPFVALFIPKGAGIDYLAFSREVDCFMAFLDAGARLEEKRYFYYPVFRHSLRCEKFAVAQKIYDIDPSLQVDKKYLGDLVHEYRTISQLRFLMNLGIDISQKNFKGKTIIEELLQDRRISHLSVLIEKYPNKFSLEQTSQYNKLVQEDKNLYNALKIFGVACFVLFVISTKNNW